MSSSSRYFLECTRPIVEFRLGRLDVIDLIVEMEVARSIHHREDSPWLLRVKLPPVMHAGARWTSDNQHSAAPLSASISEYSDACRP